MNSTLPLPLYNFNHTESHEFNFTFTFITSITQERHALKDHDCLIKGSKQTNMWYLYTLLSSYILQTVTLYSSSDIPG